MVRIPGFKSKNVTYKRVGMATYLCRPHLRQFLELKLETLYQHANSLEKKLGL